VSPREFKRLFGPKVKADVVEVVKRAGYVYVAADLEGYRSGSMDALLGKEEE
jgi:PP-loop superfamily ATP-utilizing enzyme